MDKRLAFVIFFFFFILAIRILLYIYTKPHYKEGQRLNFETNIFSQPRISNNSQSFSVNAPSGDIIFVTTTSNISYAYADRIKISGPVRILPLAGELHARDLEGQSYGASNRESQVLSNKSQILTMRNPQISFVSQDSLGFGLAVARSVRQKITAVFQKNLDPDSSALLLGIVFGIKQNMSEVFLRNIKTVGVMHVIAASGMNVTMVGGFIFYIFSLVFKRQLAIIVSILVIIFYAFLAGFQPSIIRASIMGIIAFSAQGLGKQQYGFYALLLTGFLMLFASPQFLFDIGFQLSFLSTLGILFIPSLFPKWENFASEDFLTTISAQLATLPILLINFGNYSIWSVVVNVLVLWTVPILMVLGGIAAIFSFISTPLATFLIYLCIPILSYFEQIVELFGSLGGKVTLDNFPWQLSVAYYLFLASLIMIRKITKQIS